jgi:hypothetical protein
VQKIETGGTNNTSTPILKFRMNELFEPSEARHIAHWAKAGPASRKAQAATIAVKVTTRISFCEFM